MTKSELIAKLAARYPQLVAKDAELAVKMILDAMAKSLSQGQRIEIRGFGSFGLNYRPPRTGRNPKSGEKVQVPAKYVPHFKAGKELRERVDGRAVVFRQPWPAPRELIERPVRSLQELIAPALQVCGRDRFGSKCRDVGAAGKRDLHLG